MFKEVKMKGTAEEKSTSAANYYSNNYLTKSNDFFGQSTSSIKIMKNVAESKVSNSMNFSTSGFS